MSFLSGDALLFTLSGVIMSLMMVLVAVTDDENFGLIAVVLLGPSVIAGVLTAWVAGRAGLKSLFVRQMSFRFGPQWYAAALLLIPLVALAGIGLRAAFGGPDPEFFRTSLFPQVIFLLIISLGEEFGWRGYALPRLQLHFNALQSSLILGLLWGFWHFPAYLVGTGTPMDMPFYVFMLWVIPATILITWVYNNTGSIVAALAMHTAANFAFSFFSLIPEQIANRELTTFWVFLGVLWTVTIAVVVLFGPASLSRRSARPVTA